MGILNLFHVQLYQAKSEVSEQEPKHSSVPLTMVVYTSVLYLVVLIGVTLEHVLPHLCLLSIILGGQVPSLVSPLVGGQVSSLVSPLVGGQVPSLAPPFVNGQVPSPVSLLVSG